MSGANAGPPADWRRRILAATTGLVLIAAWVGTGADPGPLIDRDGLANAAELVSGMARPDLSRDFAARVLGLTVESLAIGALGMLFALMIALPLALIAARVPDLVDPPARQPVRDAVRAATRWGARLVLAALRGIPDIVWAFLFVRIVGLGPGPAVLAIALSFGGIVGKLYSELIEACDPRPVRALRAAGATRLGALVVGALPQVRSQLVGYGLFRLECAVRSAAILGIVGAGGLGAEIELSIRYFQYDKLATALLAVLACVIMLEGLSIVLRQRATGWSLALLAAAAAAAVVVLDVPWSDIASANSLGQLRDFLFSFGSPNLDPDFARLGLSLAGQTLAMALIATALAGAIALVASPFATRVLTVHGYLPDPPRAGGVGRLGAWVTLVVSRFVLQLTRALPELVWALIFVVWVGPGALAGLLAIAAHNVGILGRLFGEVYEEAEPDAPRALEAAGAGVIGRWTYGVLPQTAPRLLAYGLFRFEVNVRATATVGFVGAGGIGDAIHTAISLFHLRNLATLLLILLGTVAIVDAVGDHLRHRLLRAA